MLHRSTGLLRGLSEWNSNTSDKVKFIRFFVLLEMRREELCIRSIVCEQASTMERDRKRRTKKPTQPEKMKGLQETEQAKQNKREMGGDATFVTDVTDGMRSG